MFLGAGLGPGGSRLGDVWTWTGQFFSLWKPKIDQEEAVQNKELCPCWISSYVPGFPSEGGNCFACRPGRSVALESHVLLLHRSTTSFCDFVIAFCLSVQIWGGRASFSLFWEPCLWLPSTRGVSVSSAKKVPQNGKKEVSSRPTIFLSCRPHLYTVPAVAARRRPVVAPAPAAPCFGSHPFQSLL